MLKVILTRMDKENGVWLSLPSTPADIGEAYAALDNINGTENLDTSIIGVESSIPNLRQYLSGKSTDDPKIMKELDFIARRIDGFVESEAALFSGALDIEFINTLADIINLTYSLEGDELYPDVSTAREIEVVTELSRKAIFENVHVTIRQDECLERNNGYLERHRKATERVSELENLKREKQSKNHTLECFIRNLESVKLLLMNSTNAPGW